MCESKRFSPVNVSYTSLIIKPVQEPRREQGKLPLHHPTQGMGAASRRAERPPKTAVKEMEPHSHKTLRSANNVNKLQS